MSTVVGAWQESVLAHQEAGRAPVLMAPSSPCHGMGTHSGRSPLFSQALKDIPGDTLGQSVSCVRLRLLEVTLTLHTKGRLGLSGFP